MKLHLYGKLSARRGRKMGHLTALGNDAEGTVRHARLHWKGKLVALTRIELLFKP